MSVGLSGLVVVRSFDLVLSAVAILALGAAFVVPNLAAMVASDSGGRFGEALGLKSSATSLGQFLGPLVGGAMLGWVQSSPYMLAAVVLLVLGVFLARFGPRTNADEKQCIAPGRYTAKKVEPNRGRRVE